MNVAIERIVVGANRRTSIVTHEVQVEVAEDRKSIRIIGALPADESNLLEFDHTFSIGELINGRGEGRDTWNGHIVRLGKNKVTLEGYNTGLQHLDFKEFVEFNFRGDHK